MIADHLERGEKPLARLAVKILDALTQPLDRFDQVVPLGRERGMLGLDLAQLFLGAQIDRAKPFALAPQPFELDFDLAHLGKRLVRRHAGEARDLGGLDLEHVMDLAGDITEAALAAFEPLLRPRRLLARRAHGFERRALRAVGFSDSSCAAAPSLRSLQAWRSAASAVRRRPEISASRASAWASARTSASRARWPSTSPRTAASCASMFPAGGNPCRAHCASSRAVAASSRLAVRRALASANAERRAASRPASRSACACRSRVACASCCSARQRVRAAASASAGQPTPASAAPSAFFLLSTSPRTALLSALISARRFLPASRRGAPAGAPAGGGEGGPRPRAPSPQ